MNLSIKYLEPISKIRSAADADIGAAPSSAFTEKSSMYLSGYTSGFSARLSCLAPNLSTLATNRFLRWVLVPAAILLLSACDGGVGDSGEFEYVAIGASDAVGIGATPLDNGYVYRIQDGLEDDGKDVSLLNLGIPDANLEAIDEIETPLAIEEEPELITIFVGANDIVAGVSPEDFQNDLSEMLSDLQADTEALIVIANIPDLTQLPRFKEEPDSDVTTARVGTFNDIIQAEAQANGVLIVDLASQPIIESEVSDDGFHPNSDGYKRIADLFLAVIRQHLPAA